MENNIEKTLNDFLNDEKTFEEKVKEQKKRFIKNDKTIIERIDVQVITEDGRLLLREQY